MQTVLSILGFIHRNWNWGWFLTSLLFGFITYMWGWLRGKWLGTCNGIFYTKRKYNIHDE